ncbi:transketolase-like TK C-terminal-containing protein [Nocardioides sp. Bht2]|uniref:transketolase-like TK C-terminal-containing protein n=1 Tax=Nocardioides sp. Bht2 TaxID=3392297 RepID=UPI0039B4E7B0
MSQLQAEPQIVPAADPETLNEIAAKVRWLATSIVDAANRRRPNSTGVKVGGHQASSASMVEIMTSLWFAELDHTDRVSVKPHASPALHAINYLLGQIDERHLDKLREKGGLQSYPSRLKDPGTVDFSTGSVGIGATAPLWAAVSHRYLRSRFASTPSAGRFVSLLGDAELDEGAIWEAVADPTMSQLGEVLWIVDLNRQSLDRVVPDIQIARLQGMFEAAGWQVITLKWGRTVSALFEQPGGDELRQRLESMTNEEYQRMLRADECELVQRLLGTDSSAQLRAMVTGIPVATLAIAVRDLGGHDIGLLLETYRRVDDHRPTVVFAYTVKGRGLPIEGHPNNHSALLTEEQMIDYAERTGNSLEAPWARFAEQSAAQRLCVQRAGLLERASLPQSKPTVLPATLGYAHKSLISTQAALGRLLSDLARVAPETAARIVTCSPDVASSTNLGGWINKTGVWSASDRRDWFADDKERMLRWSEATSGQHIELGIAEVNLVSLLGELGATWSRWGERLIPIGTIYDPFVTRALEPWSYGMYAGGQSILVGTPSGVTLAPEGGAHQSITTPSVGLEQPGCVSWEPAFAQDLEWTMLHTIDSVGIPGGTSAYFRLTTRPLAQSLAALPSDPNLIERRRRHALAGGYRLSGDAARDQVTLVGVGAIMPEVCAAAETLAAAGVEAGVLVLTSPDLVYRSFDRRGRVAAQSDGSIVDVLFPAELRAPIVSIQDGHPHTLSFLGAIRGDRSINLGVRGFGQSSNLDDAYALHGIDTASIVDAALTLVGR